MGLGASGIKAFLTALAVEGGVSASTQNQALSALLFLYRDVLGIDSPWMSELIRTKRPARLPGVLMHGVALLLDGMSGVHGLT